MPGDVWSVRYWSSLDYHYHHYYHYYHHYDHDHDHDHDHYDVAMRRC